MMTEHLVTVNLEDLRAVLQNVDYLVDRSLVGPVDRLGDAVALATMRRVAAPDALRERVEAWVDDQRQLLPEHRTPVAHGKAELLRDLCTFLTEQ